MPETPPNKKFYLTTPIYYVNARPHIGHAYTTLVADTLARRHRLLGDDTYLLTGTDEHGQKIERSAAAVGVPPQGFADEVSASFRTLWDRMGITYDDFIRTTEERHKAGVQKLFAELEERDAIYLGTYTGQYCVPDEAYVDGPPGIRCPDCGRVTETVSEENYYFKLSAYGNRIITLIESGELAIQPDSRRNEVLSFLRSGLKDLSISRTSFSWGVPVPGNPKHVIYVWLDALANYVTAIGYGADDPAEQAKFERYWPADLHLVGKEIIRFHCVYWPAFLLAAELPLPRAVTAHGWLLFEESKMSKSRGNIVRTETILDGFGEHVYAKQFPDSTKRERDLFATDVLRYFLLREIPFGQDGSFSFDAMITRYNADLANGYGNLVSRTLSLIEKTCLGQVPSHKPFESFERLVRSRLARAGYSDGSSDLIEITGQGPELAGHVAAAALLYDNAFENLRFASPIDPDLAKGSDAGVLNCVAYTLMQTDGFISANAPWKLAKLESSDAKLQLHEVLYTAAEAIRIITALLYPILPFATAKVWAQLGLGSIEEAAARGDLRDLQWGGLKPGTRLGPLAPIFPRADKGLAQIMADTEQKNAPAAAAPAPDLTGVTSQADAATSTASPLPEAPLSSVAPSPERLASETTGSTSEISADPTDPAAPPRTSALATDNPGAQVGGTAAPGPELNRPPSHTEAPASGPFANAASAQPLSAGPADASPQITIDDFAKVELRVAEIRVAERIPKADKLLRLEVDLGFERRQILSGIAEWYAPEDLVGRRIAVVTNLAPRKMRGLESHGMLLAASDGDGGKPVLASFGPEIALGSRIK